MPSAAAAKEIRLPADVVCAILRLQQDSISGQVILNFNRGDVQSFEIKEHYRIRSD